MRISDWSSDVCSSDLDVAAKRKKREEHEEHENEERWLITYADMITLLMVLFIVLFSISQVDLKKFEQFKDGLNEFGNGGGQASLIELNSAGLLTGGKMAQLEEAQRALDEETTQEAAAANEGAALQGAQAQIVDDLHAAGLDGAAGFRIDRQSTSLNP